LGDVVTSSPLAPSLTIGRYEILSCIGVGGMGAVYRARDTRLERDVALKFLPVHVRAPRAAEEQLLTEAKTAAALEHVNVCTVHEIGETDDGRPFIAMAFYEGETLRDRLRRGPLAVHEAVDIGKQIARGLGAAHARSIVHRDVKPGNVMLTPDGTVKLLDFGLAQVEDTNATRSGMTPGTMAYMSPEQVLGELVGPRSDLWSLGVVLYEMLTGTQPFRGETHSDVRHAISHAKPQSISRLQPGTPPSLQGILTRLLEKEPQARYASAAEVLTDLDLTLRPKTSRLTSTWVGIANQPRGRLVLLGSLLAVFVAGALWRRPRETAPASLTPTTGAAAPVSAAKSAVPGIGMRSVAVLPFTNVYGDSAEAYLSDGLSEALIAALSKVRTLRVVARTSAFAFKADTRDIRDIGKALNVSTVVEGSIQKVGERIRVTAQLINAADGVSVWSETYDRNFVDVFSIQNELATRIASALAAELTTVERERLARRPTTSPEALTMYLKGRYFWHQRTRASYERAIQHFKRAIEIDPRYAAPQAGLAAVYSQQGMSGVLPAQEAQRLMRESALRALELDDGFAEAHSMLGVYLLAYEADMDAAEREHLRAIALEPGNATARNLYGNFLRTIGRVDEAIVQQSLAVALDPLAPALSEILATTLHRAGRMSEAYDRVQDAIELDSTYWRARAVRALIYERTGRPNEAIREYERANALAGGATHRTKADIARVLASTGREAEARQLVAELRSEAARVGFMDPAVATALLALGDVDAAHAWLEEAYRQRNP
ncbi:MAG: protein kinase domain-containing protein, partial [Gemmatimonadaceae bacterium]